jgi:hypothetical protein
MNITEHNWWPEQGAIERAVYQRRMELGSPVRLDGHGSQRDLKYLVTPFIRYRDVVALTNHARFFGANPVGDEASMILSLLVIRALVTKQIMSGEIAS